MSDDEPTILAQPLLLNFLGYLQAQGKLKAPLIRTQAEALVDDFVEQQRRQAAEERRARR